MIKFSTIKYGIKEPYNKWINQTALGRHALCLTGSIREGLIAKVAPVTLRACPFRAKPCARARWLSMRYTDLRNPNESEIKNGGNYQGHFPIRTYKWRAG